MVICTMCGRGYDVRQDWHPVWQQWCYECARSVATVALPAVAKCLREKWAEVKGKEGYDGTDT